MNDRVLRWKLSNGLVLALISEFGSMVGIPTNLHYMATALLRPLDLLVEGHYSSNTKARISTSGLARVLTERYGFSIEMRRVECTLLSSRSRSSLCEAQDRF